jgi:hypothetical protein
MPPTHVLTAQARDVLAELFPDADAARLVAKDAGLNLKLITASNQPQAHWDSILEEAQKAGRVLVVLDRALKDYPAHVELKRVRAAWVAHEPRSYQIEVQCADITTFPCDVLALKYAQAFYRTDTLIASRLREDYATAIAPRPGEFELLPTEGKIAAEYALFLGVEPLYRLDYGGIRRFAENVLTTLARALPTARHIIMTIHGTGFGLDETEAFLAQVGGLTDAFRTGNVPSALERVTIVEREPQRAKRLTQVLNEHLYEITRARPDLSDPRALSDRVHAAGTLSNAKPHVFVAIPSTPEMINLFGMGIQGPVQAAGYLCETLDMSTLERDVLERAKSRIETAALVIADFSKASPGAYLGVGYAWGCGRPTLLILKEGAKVKVDLPDQPCLTYASGPDLQKQLEADLRKYLA